MKKHKPHNILCFDSGAGGLSIVEALGQHLSVSRLDTSHAKSESDQSINIFYQADFEGFPYSRLEPQEILERVVALVEASVKKHDIDLVILACNTASTVSLEQLRQRLAIPVVGVVPAVKPAALTSENRQIVVVATPVTVLSQYLKNLKDEFASDCQVHFYPAGHLVEAAEAFVLDPLNQSHQDSIEQLVEQDVETILAEFNSQSIDFNNYPDRWVMACTHFPLLAPWFYKSFERLHLDALLIDSGKAIAQRVCYLLDIDPDQKSAIEFQCVAGEARFANKRQAYVEFVTSKP